MPVRRPRGPPRPRTPRATPEADAQRAIVHTLRMVLPKGSIVHHSANEVRGRGAEAHRAQGINTGMGVHPGFADLMVISEGRVLFLEVKSAKGRLRESQAVFRDEVRTQGFGWELVRSVDDALNALRAHGFSMRLREPG